MNPSLDQRMWQREILCSRRKGIKDQPIYDPHRRCLEVSKMSFSHHHWIHKFGLHSSLYMMGGTDKRTSWNSTSFVQPQRLFFSNQVSGQKSVLGPVILLMQRRGLEKLRLLKMLTNGARLSLLEGNIIQTSRRLASRSWRLGELELQEYSPCERPEGWKKENRFFRERQIEFMIYEHFRVTGTNECILDFSDFTSVTLRGDDVQGFDTKWDEVLLCMGHFCFVH